MTKPQDDVVSELEQELWQAKRIGHATIYAAMLERILAALRANQRNDVYEECARVAEAFKRGEPVNDKRDDGSRSFGFGVDVASGHIAKQIRALAKEQNDV